MRVIGYCRVSTQEQVTEGCSLEAQAARLELFAASKGLPLVMFADRGLSAGSMKRQGLREALEAVQVGDILAVTSFSRLSRSTKDLLEIASSLDKRGIELASLSEALDTSTPAGRLMFTLLGALAEFERGQLSERTQAALAYKRSVGQAYSGHAPYGYAAEGGKLVPVPAEQLGLSIIKADMQKGDSLRLTCARLARRMVPCRGKQWHPSTIRAIRKRIAAGLEVGSQS